MDLLLVRIKLVDSRSENLGIELNPDYSEASIVAQHISMCYPNNDEDTGEDITTVEMMGGQTHSVYEPYDSFWDRWVELIKPNEIVDAP